MYSLGLNVPAYIRKCSLKGFPDYWIDTLDSYDEAPEKIVNRFLQHDSSGGDSGVFISSVLSSGRMFDSVIQAFAKGAGKTKLNSIILYSSDRSRAGVFCHVPAIFEREGTPCLLCEAGSTVAKIHPITYHVGIAAKTEPVRITRSDSEKGKDFLSRYPRLAFVQLHKDEEGKARHHMIYIDVPQLLFENQFQSRLTEITRNLGQIDLVVFHNHFSALNFAMDVSRKLSCPAARITGNSPDDPTIFKNAKRLLIVDDVAITGHRLQSLKNTVNRPSLINPNTEVLGLVGVVRPSSQDSLRGIKDVFHATKNFHSVEEIILPNWGEQKCPWCAERTLLQNLKNLIEPSSRLEKRLLQLQNTQSGISQHPFFLVDQDGEWQIGPGSIFGSAQSEIALFFSVCNAIQILRDRGTLHTGYFSPISKILEPFSTVDGRFYDGRIKASILRAAERHDLRSVQTDKALSETMTHAFRDDSYKGFIPEICFASACEKLPPLLTQKPVLDIIAKVDPGLKTYLEAILNK